MLARRLRHQPDIDPALGACVSKGGEKTYSQIRTPPDDTEGSDIQDSQ